MHLVGHTQMKLLSKWCHQFKNTGGEISIDAHTVRKRGMRARESLADRQHMRSQRERPQKSAGAQPDIPFIFVLPGSFS